MRAVTTRVARVLFSAGRIMTEFAWPAPRAIDE
jgi:hypothetical protein